MPCCCALLLALHAPVRGILRLVARSPAHLLACCSSVCCSSTCPLAGCAQVAGEEDEEEEDAANEAVAEVFQVG